MPLDDRTATFERAAIGLPVEQAVLLEEACDHYEAKWRAGGRPDIEAVVAELPADMRAAAIGELIALDAFYRRKNGEQPLANDYLARFPDLDPDSVVACLAEEPDAPGSTTEQRGAVPALEPGTRVGYFGDYELLEEIARGGMGVVYRAKQLSLDRIVALKMIRSGEFAGAGEARRFRQEVEAVAALDHPNIVPIHEVGEHKGRPFYSMRLLEGGSLSSHVGKYTVTAGLTRVEAKRRERATAALVGTIARAVHHAHQRGILHRDLKPSNVLLDDKGEPHVVDFGLARRIGSASSLTATGAVLGTPSYMAPEQARGGADITTQADVYGLGAVLYELLTGRPPFKGTDPLDTVAQVREREVTRPRSINPAIDRDLETIALKCLQKEPARRYDTAQALAADLERWAGGVPILARPTGTFERARRWCVRNPAWTAVIGVSVPAVVAFITLIVGYAYATKLEKSNHDLTETQGELRTALGNLEIKSDEAEQQRAKAVANHQEAEKQRQKAAEEEARAKRFLYASEMVLAKKAVEENRIAEALRILEALRPEALGADLRGPEWYHYWTRASGYKELIRIPGGAVTALAFSPGGRELAAAGSDGTVVIALLTTQNQRLRVLGKHSTAVSEFQFAADRQFLLSASQDEVVKAWDWQTEREVPLDITPEVSVAAAELKNRVKERMDRLVQSLGPKPTKNERERALALRPVQNDYVRNGDGRVVLRVVKQLPRPSLGNFGEFPPEWSFKSDPEYDRWPFLRQKYLVPVVSLAMSGDEQVVAVGLGDRRLLVADAGEQVFSSPSLPTTLAINATGTELAVGCEDGAVRLWNLARPQAAKGTRGFEVSHVAFHPNGRYAVSKADNITLWDIRTRQPIRTMQGTSYGYSRIALSPDGARLTDGSTIWNVDTGLPVRRMLHNGRTGAGYDACFSPDGKLMATGEVGVVQVWDVETGETRHRFVDRSASPTGNGWALSLAFSPDGRTLAVGYGGVGFGGNSVCIFDLTLDREVLAFSQPTTSVWGVAFSPDGSLLAAARGNYLTTLPVGDVKLWNVRTGREIACFPVENPCVWRVAFSPDGRRLAAACGVHTPSGNVEKTFGGELYEQATNARIKVWDVETQLETLHIEATRQPFRCVAFSPDGQSLLACDRTGTISLFGRHSSSWSARPAP